MVIGKKWKTFESIVLSSMESPLMKLPCLSLRCIFLHCPNSGGNKMTSLRVLNILIGRLMWFELDQTKEIGIQCVGHLTCLMCLSCVTRLKCLVDHLLPTIYVLHYSNIEKGRGLKEYYKSVIPLFHLFHNIFCEVGYSVFEVIEWGYSNPNI